MQDIQKGPAEVSIPIDRVGVKNLSYPLVVRYKEDGVQHTVAQVDLYVDLPGQFKGTHMSRFVEALQEWEGILDYHSFRKLLRDVQSRLEARRSHLSFRFPFFLDQKSPQTGSPGLMEYQCRFEGSLEEGKPNMFLSVEVPVMTVCPCSLAISDQGAHSQRAMVRIKARFEGLLWLEDLIEIAQRSSSSPVYAVLKRADEKYVTEHSFANPKFVEDVVREVGQQLREHELVRWFKAEVESYESIHKHNAYACIEIENQPV